MKMTMVPGISFLCFVVGFAMTVDAAFTNEEFGRAAATRGLALKRKVSWKSAPPKTSSMNKSKGGNMSSKTGSKGGSMVMSMFHSHKKSKGKFLASNFSMTDDYLFSELDREIIYADMSMSMSMPFGYPNKPSGGSKGKPPAGSKGKPSVGSPNQPSVTMPTAGKSPTPSAVLAPVQSPSSGGSTPPISPTVSESPTETVGPTQTKGPAQLDDDSSFADDFIVNDDAFNMTSGESTGMNNITQTTVFDLDEDTGSVVIVPPPIEESTVVRLEITYLVEADVNETVAFEADIDEMIFVTAVTASLGASGAGVFGSDMPITRRLAVETYRERHLLSTSSFQRPCPGDDTSTKGVNCFIMAADIVYILNGERDVRFPAYYAYLALSDEMDSYAEELPDVRKVEYLTPEPRLPPIAVESNTPSGDQFISSGNDRIGSNRPWLIGSGFLVVAACGLVIAIVRKKRRQNDRYIEPMDVEGDACETSPESSPRESAQREVVSHPV